jgi:DNA-binding LacI/PurR family transcriptional regulator
VTSPTLEQVAALAGVSRATVSRVVNGSPKVSPAVRAQVERAVAKLGYVPNRAARSLVTRRADSVALVVSEPHTRFLSEPFFAGMVRGVSAALAETVVQLLLLVAHDLPDGPGRGRRERYVAGGQVDGVLLASLHHDDPLPGVRDMGVGQDRLDGYRDGLRAAGLSGGDDLVEAGDFTSEGAAAAMGRLLKRPGRPVDAVFAVSDLMAAGALRTLWAAGRRVPDDVAVVGSRTRPWPATPSRP